MSKVSCEAAKKHRRLLSASGTCLATTEAERRTLRMARPELYFFCTRNAPNERNALHSSARQLAG